MTESTDLTNKSKLEDPEFMDKPVDTLATKVEEFLDDPRWATKSVIKDISRDTHVDTRIVVDRIRRKERLDDLSIPADVSIVIHNFNFYGFLIIIIR